MSLHLDKKERISVPAVLNKQLMPVKGKDSIEYVEAKAELENPVVITSDLHHNAKELIPFIAEKIKTPEKFIFISAGDMAGTGIIGSNGDPSEALQEAKSYFKAVFCVNGNHDEKSRVEGMRNNDRSYCHIHNRVQTIDGIGTIAGIDGIISRKKLVHRMPKKEYLEILETVMSQPLEWLITHDVPQIPEITTKKTGDFDFREKILKSQVRFHVFGHSNFKNFYGVMDGTTFINVDSRVVCIRN